MNIAVLLAVIMYKKEKTKLVKFQGSINRLKYADHKIFCICIDVYKIYEGYDIEKLTVFNQIEK